METLRAMDKFEEIDSRCHMVHIVHRLSQYIQNRWRKDAVRTLERTHRYPTIMHLITFLETVAREILDPVYGAMYNKPR